MVITLISGAAFMMYLIMERINHRRLARQNLENVDNFPIFNFDSTRLYLRSNRRSILVYFDSGCDHCQYELNQIFVNKNSFKDLDIVLMSSELISTIKLYAERNCPIDLANIHFAKISQADAYNTFGSLAVPQIFIYGADGVLIKEFKGETKMEAVLQYL
jgi:thioredoxin-related protein